MKLYNEDLQKIKRIKNKSLLEEDLIVRLSAILKQQPSLYFNKKIKKLDKIKNYLKEKSKKIENALDKLKGIKNQLENQIKELETENSKVREDLLKKLIETKKGRTKSETIRK